MSDTNADRQDLDVEGFAAKHGISKEECEHACNCDPLGGVFRVEC